MATLTLDLDKDMGAVIALRAYAETFKKTDPSKRLALLKQAREAEEGFEKARVLEIRKSVASKLGVPEAEVAEAQAARAKGERWRHLPAAKRLIHEMLDVA